MYRCRIERDSVSPQNVRLTSFVITFPRIVLAEAVTHRRNSDTWSDCERNTTRDISKNSASSRAVPFWRMLEAVLRDPYVPERFSGNGPGMQGHGWLEGNDHDLARGRWLDARDSAVVMACKFLSEEDRANLLDRVPRTEVFLRMSNGLYLSQSVHKQDINRLLEPFSWVTQIVTATEWDNYFALRCHSAAHPALQRISRMMYLCRKRSTPEPLCYGKWHLPFVSIDEQRSLEWRPYFLDGKDSTSLPSLIRHSAARCAWISYENHDRDGTPEQMDRTFARLVGERPVHASPVEHQATPEPWEYHSSYRSNLRGWVQARKLIDGEHVARYEPSDEEINSWGITDPEGSEHQ